MTFSLNEVEVTSKKAARGAGYTWGLSEEAGKATRWLCHHDIDGCAVLAKLLQETDGADLSSWTAVPGSLGWSGDGGRLCPIITGATISDRADNLKRDSFQFSNVVQPLLLLPFVGMAAKRIGETLTVNGDRYSAQTDGFGLSLKGVPPDRAEMVSVEISSKLGKSGTTISRANPNSAAWAELIRFAHRTYAPATAESRAKGAGAGTTDND